MASFRYVRVAWLGNTPQDCSLDYFDHLHEETLSAVRTLLADSDSTINEPADLRGVNGDWHVSLAGCHNHHDRAIVELCRAIASTAPGSYGILYTFDDEASDGWDRSVMRRSIVHNARDEDPSPHIGMVEHPQAFG